MLNNFFSRDMKFDMIRDQSIIYYDLSESLKMQSLIYQSLIYQSQQSTDIRTKTEIEPIFCNNGPFGVFMCDCSNSKMIYSLKVLAGLRYYSGAMTLTNHLYVPDTSSITIPHLCQ